jgi:hypothetical protein
MKIKIMVLGILAVVALSFISGCVEESTLNKQELNSPLKTSIDGIIYKIVVIEEHKYIATQTSYGFWTLAYLPE